MPHLMPEDINLALTMIRLEFKKNIVLAEIPNISSSLYNNLKKKAGHGSNLYLVSQSCKTRKLHHVLSDKTAKRNASLFMQVYLLNSTNAKNRMDIHELINSFLACRDLFLRHCKGYSDPLKNQIIDVNLAWQLATEYKNDIIDMNVCTKCKHSFVYLTCHADVVCNGKCCFCNAVN